MRLRIVGAVIAAIGLVALAAPAAHAASGTPGIIGGQYATESYPFAASVQLNGGHYCGASPITPQWLVTAAHCVEQPAGAYQVRIGSHDWTRGGALVGVAQIVVNPGWNGEANDIALIRLAQQVPQTPIAIGQSPAVGATVRLLGWGSTQPNGQGSSQQLKQVDRPVVADNQCTAPDAPAATTICISTTGNSAACHGDSGGPMIAKSDGVWTLVGATHGGPDPCGPPNNVYTDVAAFGGWITQTTGADPSPQPHQCDGIPAWSPYGYYGPGDQVTHSNHHWKATTYIWWGEEPGSSGAWQDQGSC